MNDFLPIMIDLAEREVVIFGGGDVGERKAKFFCDHAIVTVISRDFTSQLDKLSEDKKIKLIKVKDLTEPEICEYMKNAFIVIPATNNALLNEKVSWMAGQGGKLVNRVDGIGDIIIPSVIERGDIIIGISTLGQSPALSKYIRHKIETVVTPEFKEMSRLQNEIREILKSRIHDQKERKEILWNILDDENVWKAFGESYEKAYKVALKHIDRTG
ncbi:MAG: bifunctional precorrin-2 dehydrogenase/sirohydrochlorin ferrochelatase [Candidatus Methanoperedens sp.]|nr:bifunctional precorrin-2 dehydrogenase/sirohydrochlorin ferrochelatase [Candidatus Methanoperedens sp.]